MKVIKRDGSKEELDVGKIRAVLNRALDGLDLPSHLLESESQILFKDGMETRHIQKSLIHTAVRLVEFETPEWSLAAGRLLHMDLCKEVALCRASTPYSDYLNFVKEMVAKEIYASDILERYTEEEVKEAGSWIVSEWDEQLEYPALYMMMYRYLVKEGNNVVEMPQEAFLTIALLLASTERNSRMEVAKQIYEALGQRKLSLATPILLNLRRPNGSLTSCFISQIGDDLDSIFHGVHQFARISKKGGGMGIDVSHIRAAGSWVNKRPGVSGGIVPFIRIFNDTAVAVNQEGVRAGSATIALASWHADMPAFLELQTEAGDQRHKAFDIFPQVICSDEFMRRVKADQPWYMVCPFEVKKEIGVDLTGCWGEIFEQRYHHVVENRHKLTICREVKARNLFKDILKRQFETGKPYLAFIDAMNRANPNKHDGMIPCVNLCVESFSNVKPTIKNTPNGGDGLVHCCNLLSLVMTRLEDDELEPLMNLAVRVLDNTIDLTSVPVEEALAHNNRYRTLGVGVMGWADWLAKREISYLSPEALKEADRVFERLAYYGFDASLKLVTEDFRKPFEAFDDSELSKGRFFGREPEPSENLSDKDGWRTLGDKIKQHGCRNSQIMAIAPTTSTSLVQGAMPSFLPAYSLFYQDKMGAQSFSVTPLYAKEKRWFYPEMKNMDQSVVVNMTATIQKWIDTGISMELVFNQNSPDFSPKKIYDTILEAWEKGVKAVYYIRSIQKDSRVTQKEECVSCSG